MKNLYIISFLTAITLTTEANNGRSHESFTYYGGDSYENVRLSDQKEVWATETRTVPATCSRQEPYQVRVCRTNYGPRPHYYDASPERPPRSRRGRTVRRRPGHRPPPPRGGSQTCRMETKYRTVNYSCSRTETVRVRRPGQRFLANVNFNFIDKTLYPELTQADFNISLNERNLQVHVRDMSRREPVLFLAKHSKRVDTSRRNVYEIFSDYKVIVASKRTLTSPFEYPLEIRSKLRDGYLKIKAGHIEQSKPLELVLTVEDRYSRHAQTVVIKGSEITHHPGRRNPERSVIEVDLRHYFPNADLYQGVEVKAELKLNSKLDILNRSDLGSQRLSSSDSRLIQN